MNSSIWRGILKQSWIAFAIRVAGRFGGNNGALIAAGLAFFTLLSLPPLLLTGAAVLAFFIHSPEQVSMQVEHIVRGFFPSGGAQVAVSHLIAKRIAVGDQVRALIRGRTLAGLFGVVALIWTSMQVFVSASTAMNATFDVVEKRSWIRVRVVALALLLVSAVLVTITLFLSAAPPAIERFRHGYFPEVPIPLWLLTIAFEILAVPVNALLYVILFQYLPSTETGWKPALVGGLTASILWEVAKKGLASWILRANHTIFGDLANVILFLLWIYYSMIIMLIGAEVAAEMSRLHAKCRSNAASKR